MSKRKIKQYTVSCEVKIRASVNVSAASLEDALTAARGMSVTDFVEPVQACFDDYDGFEITGVFG